MSQQIMLVSKRTSPAENTSEIEKYFSSKNGVVWETDVLERIGRRCGCKFPSISDTEAVGLQWSEDRALEKTPLMLHSLNILETPSEGGLQRAVGSGRSPSHVGNPDKGSVPAF